MMHMAEQTAVVSKRRRIPAIWFVPIVAGLLGIWMVVYSAMNEGPTVKIRFETAEGVEAGKTKVKSLSVQIGIVEEVRLNDDLTGVTVIAKLDPKASLEQWNAEAAARMEEHLNQDYGSKGWGLCAENGSGILIFKRRAKQQ